MTTNHLDYFDPAVYRHQRVTKIIHFGPVSPETFDVFMKNHFPHAKNKLVSKIKARLTQGLCIHHAELYDLFFAHPKCQKFLEQVLEKL